MRLIRRAAWGARYGRGGTNITPGAGGVTVHYEGGGKLTGRPHAQCAARVRGIEDYHVNGNGWQGIAYTFLVCEHGYVYEGRGLGRRTAANGTNSGNQNWYAVCALIGDSDPLADDLLTGIRDAIDFMRAHGAGRKVNGHRDHLSTSCPGTRLYAWVQRGAPRPVKPAPKPPAPAPAPTPEEDEPMQGQVTGGAAAITPISIPKGVAAGIGFMADNDLAGLPAATLRVAIHDGKGWHVERVVVDSTKAKVWVKFPDPKTTDGVSVRREDDGAVPVAWDVS